MRCGVRWLDALDRGLGGEAAVDRLVDPPRPALVIGEHLVGLEHLLMLADRAELGLRPSSHRSARASCEGGIDAVALGLGILGDGMLDQHARLVIDGMAACAMPATSLRPVSRGGAGSAAAVAGRRAASASPALAISSDSTIADGLQRLDLDIVIGARIGMLDGRARRSPARCGTIGTPAKLWNSSSPVSGR